MFVAYLGDSHIRNSTNSNTVDAVARALPPALVDDCVTIADNLWRANFCLNSSDSLHQLALLSPNTGYLITEIKAMDPLLQCLGLKPLCSREASPESGNDCIIDSCLAAAADAQVPSLSH